MIVAISLFSGRRSCVDLYKEKTRLDYAFARSVNSFHNPSLIWYFPRRNFYFDRSVGAFPGFQNFSKLRTIKAHYKSFVLPSLFGDAIFPFVNKRCHLDEKISLLSLSFAIEEKILNLGPEKKKLKS